MKFRLSKVAIALATAASFLSSWNVLAIDYVVQAGTTASNVILGNDDIQNVYGMSVNTEINGGQQTVYTGGVAVNSIVNVGKMDVKTSGTDHGTVINGGSLSTSGYTSGTTVYSGSIFASPNSVLRDITLMGGTLQASGTASSINITDATMSINHGRSSVDGTRIYDGGIQTIKLGSCCAWTEPTVTNTEIFHGGRQEVINGIVDSVDIYNGGYQIITAINDYHKIGNKVTNVRIHEGGRQLLNGGDVDTVTINGGVQDIIGWNSVTGENSQISNVTILNNGIQNLKRGSSTGNEIYDGTQNIYFNTYSDSDRAIASGTNIYNGGVQLVGKEGDLYSYNLVRAQAINTTISEGGNQYVYEKGITTDTYLHGGKTWLFTGALADGNTEIYDASEMVMEAGSRATDVAINGGTLSITDLTDETSSLMPAQVDKLTMDGGSVSFLRDSDGEFAALNITELNGTGNFLFNSSLAERNSNFVTIEQGSGHFGISVSDSGKDISDHTDLTVNLIHEQGGDIDFEMVTASGRSTRAVDGGTYMYTLFSQQNKDGLNGGNVWYLGAMTDEPGGGENPGGENPGGENPGGENPDGGDNGNAGGNGNGGKKPMTTPATDAILAMSNAGLNVIHSELDGLRTYRASLDKTGPESNVWGHYLGSKSDIDTSNGAAYQLSQNGMEIGADTRTDFAGGSLVTGAFMSFSDNKVKHARGGTSKIDSYGLGLYATWYDASGFYADGVVKGNRLNNKLRAVMTNGGRTGGDWKQYALSTAVEGGYQFDLKDDVSITPYGRLAFVQMTSEDVKLSNGMKGNTGTPRSVTGEAGAKIAGKFNIGSTEFKPYLSAAVVQEFVNSNEVTINERNRFDNNVKGTSGKYGLGTSINVGKDVTLYGEANYRQGSQIETPIQGVAGIRLGF